MPRQSPLHPWEFPGDVWKRLHIDFAGPFMGSMFMIGVDAFLKAGSVQNDADNSALPNINTFLGAVLDEYPPAASSRFTSLLFPLEYHLHVATATSLGNSTATNNSCSDCLCFTGCLPLVMYPPFPLWPICMYYCIGICSVCIYVMYALCPSRHCSVTVQLAFSAV